MSLPMPDYMYEYPADDEQAKLLDEAAASVTTGEDVPEIQLQGVKSFQVWLT